MGKGEFRDRLVLLYLAAPENTYLEDLLSSALLELCNGEDEQRDRAILEYIAQHGPVASPDWTVV